MEKVVTFSQIRYFKLRKENDKYLLRLRFYNLLNEHQKSLLLEHRFV